MINVDKEKGMIKAYKPAKAGIRLEGNHFVIDFSTDTADDIISLVSPTLYQSTVTDRIYWFGYKFNDDVSAYARTKAAKWIKGIAEKKIDDRLLGRLTDRPLGALDRLVNLTTFNCIVYPRSDRSNLIQLIKRRIS